MPASKELHDALDQLHDKYHSNTDLKTKLENYITTQLPKYMELNMNRKIAQKERKKELQRIQDKFTRKFLNENVYFYVSNTELFFHYDLKNYSSIREDDINHKILSSISRIGGDMMQWKYKIKSNIIKLIKSRSLYNTIPESNTIQSIINSLYPVLFKTRNEAKYFLTILGDSIRKNHDNDKLVFLISIKSKLFIRDIGQLIYFYTSINVFNHFKFKYHDQSYSDIRLLNINDVVENSSSWYHLKDDVINLITVACYYSERYNSSDNFLSNDCDSNTRSYALFIKNNTNDTIVATFINEYIEGCNDTLYSVSWKNMYFLWKSYLEENELPNMMFASTLKNKLSDRYKYNSETDSFTGVTSRYLPFVSKFLEFFSDNFYENSDEIEFEISEINLLFKDYVKNQKLYFDDKKILNVIKHYWENIVIIDDKFLYGWSCKIWDKCNELDNFIEVIREKGDDLSLHEAYTQYTQYQKEHNCMIASKRYFEKYVGENYSDLIVDSELNF